MSTRTRAQLLSDRSSSELGGEVMNLFYDQNRTQLERELAELALGITCLLNEGVEQDRQKMKAIYSIALATLEGSDKKHILRVTRAFEAEMRGDSTLLHDLLHVPTRVSRRQSTCAYVVEQLFFIVGVIISTVKDFCTVGITLGIALVLSCLRPLSRRKIPNAQRDKTETFSVSDQMNNTADQRSETAYRVTKCEHRDLDPSAHRRKFVVINDEQVNTIRIHKGASETRIYGWDFDLKSRDLSTSLPGGDYTVHNSPHCGLYENFGTVVYRCGGKVRPGA